MNPFLKSYSYLSRRRWLAWTIWLAVMVVAVLLSSRIRLKEDISDFLSTDSTSAKYMSVYQQIGGQNRIVVIASADEVDDENRTDSIKAISSFTAFLKSFSRFSFRVASFVSRKPFKTL